MDLTLVDIPRTYARVEAAAYAREANRENDPTRRAELERMAHAYRVASSENVGLIALTPTIAAGGTMTRTLVYQRGQQGERKENYLLPKLAVCNWRAGFCYSLGVQRDGSITLADSISRRHEYRSGVIRLQTGFTLPAGYEEGSPNVATHWRAWAAMVPIVPPKHRPNRGLGDRLVLWEVDDWRWTTVPQPPGDPALLRHVAGDIYAVEAVWHLTELERLVLTERRPA